ncbi:short chain enoyl-CoA hydratase [Plasticicumulans lactativorans]|uniref:Short chain enoyl-CoA hydratase n=1 Tax=Plasticicumulans lactativorans TaxID=1133106 RepID=A0A4R2LEG0_9GAMM|nr:2,3-dehydroadipyl-CoA hydratase PaaF [Plasticicumulans lactativorans]TCO81261.1 short chain enoyl-CoA hydratase [Plasticicumulans lactativorans]
MTSPSDIVVDRPSPGVLAITLNRPDALNALRNALLAELAATLDAAAGDDDVRCVVLGGGPKVFAAGADIKEMAALDVVGVLNDCRPGYWAAIRRFPKPIVAAVNGFALGGGCELAMLADIIVAGDNARFGQPEINLGIIPGAGGTQRLVRAVGKPLAMKLVLTGESIDARTALAAGLVAEVTVPELTQERALAIARGIAAKPPIAVRLAKECVLKAFELSLESALDAERKAFALLAATEDRREGIAAFVEKRQPEFKGR